MNKQIHKQKAQLHGAFRFIYCSRVWQHYHKAWYFINYSLTFMFTRLLNVHFPYKLLWMYFFLKHFGRMHCCFYCYCNSLHLQSATWSVRDGIWLEMSCSRGVASYRSEKTWFDIKMVCIYGNLFFWWPKEHEWFHLSFHQWLIDAPGVNEPWLEYSISVAWTS